MMEPDAFQRAVARLPPAAATAAAAVAAALGGPRNPSVCGGGSADEEDGDEEEEEGSREEQGQGKERKGPDLVTGAVGAAADGAQGGAATDGEGAWISLVS